MHEAQKLYHKEVLDSSALMIDHVIGFGFSVASDFSVFSRVIL